MNVKLLLLTFSVAASAMLLPLSGMAHSMLTKSSPAKDEVLKTMPKQVTLEFNHPTRLTQFKLVSLDQPGTEIAVKPDLKAATMTTFVIPVPALAKGKYQLKWATLAEDGHAMTGSLPFAVSGQ